MGILLAVILIAVVAVGIYWNHMLGLLGKASEHTVPTLSQEELDAILGTEETIPPTTTPEDTWPQVVSDQNITNIMLVGQNYREDEPNKLSDTMLLCSINRETHTLTMVSFLRDLYVPLPAYAGHTGGRNRINVCYALGSTWTRSSEGGMEMLAKCIEQNFGVHIDHTIEISFDTFAEIISLITSGLIIFANFVVAIYNISYFSFCNFSYNSLFVLYKFNLSLYPILLNCSFVIVFKLLSTTGGL